MKHILPFHSSNTVPVLQNSSKITVSRWAVSSAQSLGYHSSDLRNLNSSGATKCSPYNPFTWLGFQSPIANVIRLSSLDWKKKIIPSLDRALIIVPLPRDMKLLEHGRRVYLPRGLKGPAEGGSQAPMTQLSHQVQSCPKDETEIKGKP